MHMAIFLKIPLSNIISLNHTKAQGLFLKRLGSLLKEGYSVKEALQFLSQFEKGETIEWIEKIQKGMVTGNTLHDELEKCHFPNKICAQIYFASFHGNFGETIANCGKQILAEEEKKKKFRSLISYPIFLLVFLLGMLLMMRFLILPHIEVLILSLESHRTIDENIIIRWIYWSPQIILWTFLTGMALVLCIRFKLKEKSAIERLMFYMKIPFVRLYVQYFWTAFFLNEWGYLLKNGTSIQEVISIMRRKEASKLLKETGEILAEQMRLGQPMHESLRVLPFLTEGAFTIIEHGENIGQLSTEMIVYAEFCENELNQKMEKLMGKLQPIIFTFIGVMIVAIYSALMLPMFTLLEGF